MALFTVHCPECSSELTLSSRRLLVRINAGTATAGEVLFTCLTCRRTAAAPVDVAVVAALLAGGVSYLALSEPRVTHPESAPQGPPLTHDDLLDLHTELARDAWFDQLSAADC